jgi:hypothetical protein
MTPEDFAKNFAPLVTEVKIGRFGKFYDSQVAT